MTNKHPAPRFVQCMDLINRMLLKVCGLCFGIMVVLIFAMIMIRFVFSYLGVHIAAPWTEELARYLLIWTVFVAGGVGARTGQLIGIEIAVEHLPAFLGQPIKYVVHALSIGFYIALVVIGSDWTEFGLTEMAPVMGIPMAYVFTAMMVGGLIMTLNTIALILDARARGIDIRHATSQEAEIDDLLTQYAEGSSTEVALK